MLLTDDLLARDWSDLSGNIAAIGHPVRLLLLHRVLSGAGSVAELQEREPGGTTGQLYHHLRQLVAAGWLRVAARGRYSVPPERVVPLLVILAAAQR
jgi:DNA-binding HxlR family transcriptional regulator